MENLKRIKAGEINGKAEIEKAFYSSRDSEPPSPAYDYPPIKWVNEVAPSEATHYLIEYEESFFWGETRYVTNVIFFKEET